VRFGRLVAIALFGLSLGAARGSVDGLADALTERCRAALVRPRELDVAVVVSAPSPRLAGDLAELLVGRLRALGVRSATRTDGIGRDQAARAGYERVVRVEVTLEGARLRANGTVEASPSALWGGDPEARAHLFAEAALDDELRAYLPKSGAATVTVTGAGWQTRSIPVGDLEILALDLGDADGDGKPELCGVTARELVCGVLDGGRLVERWRERLYGRPAPLRPRADLATVSVEAGAVLAHASDFADGVRRTRGVGLPARGFSFPGLPVACELSPGVDWFAAETCGPLASELPERFWTAAGLRRAGAVKPIALAAITPPGSGAGAGSGGVLWLRPGEGLPLVQVRGVGAQVAIGATDRGDVVVTSEPSEAGQPDALTLRALTTGAPVLHRVEHLPGAVRAIAVGDLDGDGHGEVVAVVRDDATRKTELWIVN
jgi:hypothetical protein